MLFFPRSYIVSRINYNLQSAKTCSAITLTVTQKMIFAFTPSKNANPLSLLQVQFESPFANHPPCYNLISSSFESPLANLISASQIYILEVKCFTLQRPIVPEPLTFAT